MPCRSDYLEPNELEIENSKVLALIEEFETKKLPNWYGKGNHNTVYNNSSQEIVNSNTAKLCSMLKKYSVKDLAGMNYSLEMQIWWRDHSKFDENRKITDLNELKKQLNLFKSGYHITIEDGNYIFKLTCKSTDGYHLTTQIDQIHSSNEFDQFLLSNINFNSEKVIENLPTKVKQKIEEIDLKINHFVHSASEYGKEFYSDEFWFFTNHL